MIKLLGSVLIVAASGLGGIAVAGNYSRRPKELKSIRSALQMLETEISYGAAHLQEALSMVAERCDQDVACIFSRTAAELSARTGLTAAQAWEKSIQSYYKESALKAQDFSILRNLGASLGISDRTDQIKHLRLAMEQIGSENLRAEEEAARNVKLWSYLGFLSGFLAVIILY
ncbi:stage III sporulation protein SpoIIIAB [Pelotomaculum propionicicum]|uniref:Stage III sporulation protein AB n=1 Tax=Pelotomaculum propionicicum TaxID=258475 RepID=A0A4Y7RKS3_9FIRM|nr:stage III sporulation protein SpoIIIAB [Pelotomaculum propionicicum]NLI11984.1 stage III sporulation protein AB [Peptococcaceae bacterium]TEB08917.1 hypothetical protein Pmgp_03529 [Pelotomaculum propionicicum]